MDELRKLVSIGLRPEVFSACEAGDVNGDKQITVEEIVTAVRSARDMCK